MNDKTVAEWGKRWLEQQPKPPRLFDLQNYGRLCGMARRKDSPRQLSRGALYNIRVHLEKAIMNHVRGRKDRFNVLFKGDVFGRSSKQGVSFRLGLESCMPSPLCIDKCYAHDGRDAAPMSVQRGAYNSLIAELWENGDRQEHNQLTYLLVPKIRQAVKLSLKDARESPFRRSPRIRFSHVGDIARYPRFANWVAGQCQLEVALLKDNRAPLTCVTYTRHKKAKLLDPEKWQIVFSMDASSYPGRLNWIPKNAIHAWAAFDGIAQGAGVANVVFAEHHGARRLPARVQANCPLRLLPFICPSTLKGNPHGCDNNRCDFCYRPFP